MNSKLDWKGVGQFVAIIVKLVTIAKKAFSDVGVGIEVLEWLVEEGSGEFISALKNLGISYQTTGFNLEQPVSTVKVNATTDRFVAKDKFVHDTGDTARAKICCLGDNFKAWFLNGDGKIEDPISEQILRCHKLRRPLVDRLILAKLGGAKKSETTLTEVFCLIEKQKNGEDGVLLNNVYANIFYVRDQNGLLCAVHVRWDDDCWYVDARSIKNEQGWGDGDQVFSRLSVPTGVSAT